MRNVANQANISFSLEDFEKTQVTIKLRKTVFVHAIRGHGHAIFNFV